MAKPTTPPPGADHAAEQGVPHIPTALPPVEDTASTAGSEPPRRHRAHVRGWHCAQPGAGLVCRLADAPPLFAPVRAGAFSYGFERATAGPEIKSERIC